MEGTLLDVKTKNIMDDIIDDGFTIKQMKIFTECDEAALPSPSILQQKWWIGPLWSSLLPLELE